MFYLAGALLPSSLPSSRLESDGEHRESEKEEEAKNPPALMASTNKNRWQVHAADLLPAISWKIRLVSFTGLQFVPE